MLTIFKAEVYDEDGRSVSYCKYFSTYKLAEEFILSQKWVGCVKAVNVNANLNDGAKPNYSSSIEVSYFTEKQKADKIEKDRIFESARRKVENLLNEEEKKVLGLV